MNIQLVRMSSIGDDSFRYRPISKGNRIDGDFMFPLSCIGGGELGYSNNGS